MALRALSSHLTRDVFRRPRRRTCVSAHSPTRILARAPTVVSSRIAVFVRFRDVFLPSPPTTATTTTRTTKYRCRNHDFDSRCHGAPESAEITPPIRPRVCQRNASEPRGREKTTRRGSTTNGEREREKETENNTLAAILTAPYANPGHPVCSIVVREPGNRRATAALSLGLNCVSRVRALLLRTQVDYMSSHMYTPHSYARMSRILSRVQPSCLSPCRLGTSFVTIQSRSRSRRKLTATGGYG